MIRLFRSEEELLDDNRSGMWIDLTTPEENEITQIAELLGLDLDDITAAIDLNEKNRIEIHDKYSLMIIDIPDKVGDHEYVTLPLGIILVGDNVVTVCSKENQILSYFHKNYLPHFDKRRKISLVYEIILKATMSFQSALISINKRRSDLETHIKKTTSESDLVDLHKLESILVYFATSIRGNAGVINRLSRLFLVQQKPEDKEILGDIVIENQQATEMVQIYRDIIDSTRELLSAIIDSRLNNVMKRLTSITIILSIPTIISGLYGMNLNQDGMPFSKITNGFGIVLIITLVLCLVLIISLKKKKML